MLNRDDNTIQGSFLMQTSFAFMAAGKALIAIGAALAVDSIWGVAIAISISTAATYHVYRNSLDRLLSTFAVFFSILVTILWERDFVGSRELLLNGFMLFQVVAAAVLLTKVWLKRDYIPLTYGLLFSLCASALFLASHAKFGYWAHEEIINSNFVNLLFAAGLIAAIVWIAGGVTEKLKSEPLVLALLGALLLGVISAPGIILSIALMVLGYAKHEKIMVVMGALLVSIFLFFYY